MAVNPSVSVIQERLAKLDKDKKILESEKLVLNQRISAIDNEIATIDLTINSLNSALSNDAAEPSITKVTPFEFIIAQTSQTLTVEGAGFTAATLININGTDQVTTQDTTTPTTKISCPVPDALLTTIQDLTIYAHTPEPGGGQTTTRTVKVIHGLPSLASVTPSTVTAGSADTLITVTGAFFDAASIIRLNEVDYSTTLVGQDLTATVPAALISQANTSVDVRVFNPTPGGGLSIPVLITVS